MDRLKVLLGPFMPTRTPAWAWGRPLRGALSILKGITLVQICFLLFLV